MPPSRPPGHWRTRLVTREAGYITPCHEWSGARHRQGYGQVGIRGKTVLVHRLAWIDAYGDPGDLLVLHHCDNPPCARLDHLYLGTHSVNNRDAVTRGLNTPPPGGTPSPGERNGNHKLAESDVLTIRRSASSPSELAARYRVSRQTIHHILSRKTWRHL